MKMNIINLFFSSVEQEKKADFCVYLLHAFSVESFGLQTVSKFKEILDFIVCSMRSAANGVGLRCKSSGLCLGPWMCAVCKFGGEKEACCRPASGLCRLYYVQLNLGSNKNFCESFLHKSVSLAAMSI